MLVQLRPITGCNIADISNKVLAGWSCCLPAHHVHFQLQDKPERLLVTAGV